MKFATALPEEETAAYGFSTLTPAYPVSALKATLAPGTALYTMRATTPEEQELAWTDCVLALMENAPARALVKTSSSPAASHAGLPS
jgi:hypothetical protein